MPEYLSRLRQDSWSTIPQFDMNIHLKITPIAAAVIKYGIYIIILIGFLKWWILSRSSAMIIPNIRTGT